jgi:hypothetical protein
MADHDVLVRGVHHINYEIISFVGSLLINTAVPNVPRTLVEVFAGHAVRNGPIELRVLHARNLLEFLLSTEEKRTHYRADEYLPDWKPQERRQLQALKKRCCEHAFHLTKSRVSDEEHASGQGDKAWLLETFAPLMRATASFIEPFLACAHVAGDAPERAALAHSRDLLLQMLRDSGLPTESSNE